ncbi:leucine-rich repeat receptor-like serine/threonine/tyrosine-protein kinase SOBIR1 [Tanacetum coccineum]|uniref:Leucine-rich repeat receptor-like serine/threonine/tyrosine-protein kinase SOBIR1 n=1 Tax=Tanacetum coccineum TaxID=301880 RepID=A0ABQ5I804_9ASTR
MIPIILNIAYTAQEWKNANRNYVKSSLEKMLRDVQEGCSVLDWPLKYKIAVGVANGLEYLITTSILDCETSLLMPNNNGTLGYIDPEYCSTKFMNNGRLEKMLRDVREGRSVLDWPFKYKIAMGVANGLGCPISMIVLREPDDTSSDYHNLVDQVNKDSEIGKRIRHWNVVPLIAYVSTPRCVYLIYEFLNNGSLDKMLRDVREGHYVLDWPLEYKIAVGVANVLEYLHHVVTPNVIHQDLKTHNILLDQDTEVGIADFGLATSILDWRLLYRCP